MSNFERKHKTKLQELGVTRWLRYVDDIFSTLNDNADADTILQYLNSQHPNIKFTIEFEEGGKLPFLDTSVYRAVDSYRTTIYRKKTFTGVYLKWSSLTTRKYKVGLIYCLLNRAWKICADTVEREKEINNIRAILAMNEYPEKVVEREIEKFTRNHQESPETTSSQAQAEKVIGPEQLKRYMVLPYASQRVEGFTKRLKAHVNKFYPQVDFNVAFRTPSEIGKFFPFKDRVKHVQDRSLVVYRIKCVNEQCNASYIGKTQRILCHRLKEHQTRSESACKQHDAIDGHQMDYENVEILDTAESNFKLEMKELLHIVQRKPTLNRQLNPQSKFNIRTLIITAYQDVNEDATN